MGIEQIQSAKTKALLPAFQFNWSQMESNLRFMKSERYLVTRVKHGVPGLMQQKLDYGHEAI
jgi:hypothetical protein